MALAKDALRRPVRTQLRAQVQVQSVTTRQKNRYPVAEQGRGPVCRKQSYWRFFWAVVLLLHAPLTLNVFSSLIDGTEPVRWSSLVLLTLSNLFFILEIGYAYSFRLLSDRRKVATLLVVIALLHVGMIERGMPDFVQGADIHYWLLLTTCAALSCRWLVFVLTSSWQRLAARAATGDGLHDPHRRYARRVEPLCILRSLLEGPLFSSPRPPPLRSL